MTDMTSNPQAADVDRDGSPDAVGRPAALRVGLHNGVAAILGRISTKVRWIASAAIGLITPVVLMAESAAEPIAAAVRAMACVGNGSFMTLAATANALTLIP